MTAIYTDLLLAIGQRVITNSATTLGLYQGKAGELLFLSTLAKYYPLAVSESYLQETFSVITGSCQQLLPDLSLADGVAGIAWLIQHLAAEQPELAALNNSFDSYLKRALPTKVFADELEITKGLSGILLFLKTRSDTASAKVILEQLHNKAQWFSDGTCAWPTHFNSRFRIQKSTSVTEFNLGLAHGVPGIIAALMPWFDDSTIGVIASNLIISACNWLIAQQQDPLLLGSYYPDVVTSKAPSRLAWCYGDLTIALTLGRAALLSKHQGHYEFGREIALNCARRFGGSAMITGSALCHGSAGASVIFRLLADIYPETELKEAAEYWMEYTLGHIGAALLKNDGAYSKENHYLSSGLLNGYAGIGLCMISHSHNDTSWASALFLC